jgi:hypothetical protein
VPKKEKALRAIREGLSALLLQYYLVDMGNELKELRGE